ncbi:hypothetical protein [Microbacterium enclense]|uniref:Uncharacterized protein n=1 Tax=Microbacterium enclense TaxID=993073 RepID=A0A1G6RG55_9MICO|nr:hypothetical protein [Microbacterium enclense]SDD03344.1 hypothetical protein SAMN05216418_0117 [Microbacterium enclense]
MSGLRGVLIYAAAGVAATFATFAVVGQQAAEGVGLAFLLSTVVVFPWLVGRLNRSQR